MNGGTRVLIRMKLGQVREKKDKKKRKKDVRTEKRKASYESERMVGTVFSFVWNWVKSGVEMTSPSDAMGYE